MATSTGEIKGLEGAYSVAKKILKTSRRGSENEMNFKTNGNHRCLQTSLGTYEIIEALYKTNDGFSDTCFL